MAYTGAELVPTLTATAVAFAATVVIGRFVFGYTDGVETMAGVVAGLTFAAVGVGMSGEPNSRP